MPLKNESIKQASLKHDLQNSQDMHAALVKNIVQLQKHMVVAI
jgi:hypothetical protein